MKQTNEAWKENQRLSFTSEASTTVSIDTDTISPIINALSIESISYTKSGDIMAGSLTQEKVTVKIKEQFGQHISWLENLEPDKLRNGKLSFSASFNLGGSFYGVPMGTWYITDVAKAMDGRSATITADSILAFMTPIIEYSWNGDATSILSRIQNELNVHPAIPENNIIIHYDTDITSSVQIDIRSSDNLSYAQALQLIANACGCIIRVTGSNVYIEPYKTESERYVLSDKILYQPIEVKYTDLIGNMTLISNHGTLTSATTKTGDKIGARQIVTNPIAYGDGAPLSLLIQSMFNTMQYSRKKFTANCRLDPALELFDTITIPNGNVVDTAVVTKINATFNGAWKATIEACAINGTTSNLRICDLEQLTLAQIERMTVNQCAPTV